MAERGRTIRLFLVNGNPAGLIIAAERPGSHDAAERPGGRPDPGQEGDLAAVKVGGSAIFSAWLSWTRLSPSSRSLVSPVSSVAVIDCWSLWAIPGSEPRYYPGSPGHCPVSYAPVVTDLPSSSAAVDRAALLAGPGGTVQGVVTLAGGTHARTYLIQTANPAQEFILREFARWR